MIIFQNIGSYLPLGGGKRDLLLADLMENIQMVRGRLVGKGHCVHSSFFIKHKNIIAKMEKIHK